LYTSAYVGRLSELFPALQYISFLRLSFIGAAFVAYFGTKKNKSARLKSTPLEKYVVAFPILIAISIPVSIYVSNSLTLAPAIIILFLSVALIVQTLQTLNDVIAVSRFLAGSAAIIAIPLLLTYKTGRAQFVGSSYDPNDAAYVLVTLLPLVSASCSLARTYLRVAWALLVPLIITAIVLTGSRGGMLALAVFAAGWCIFPIQQKKDGSVLEASFSSKVLRVFFIIFSFSILLNVIPDSIRERLGTLLSIGSDYNVSTSSNLSRTLIWSRDIIAVVKRPIGFGLGSAYVVDGLNGGAYMTAHNSLVQVLVELGLAGLIVYIAIYFSAFSRVRAAGARTGKNSTPDPYGPLLARALRTSLVCNFVAGFFLSQGYSPVFWCLIALCIAFEKVTALRREIPSYAKRSKVFK